MKDLVKSGWGGGVEGVEEGAGEGRTSCEGAAAAGRSTNAWSRRGDAGYTRGNKTVQVEKTNGSAAGII